MFKRCLGNIYIYISINLMFLNLLALVQYHAEMLFVGELRMVGDVSVKSNSGFPGETFYMYLARCGFGHDVKHNLLS